MSKEIETIEGDDEDIGWRVLDWAGVRDLWDEYYLGNNHNPYSDVVTWCGSLDIDEEEYDYDRPGASGNNYVITISDPVKAKAEILARVRALMAARRK